MLASRRSKVKYILNPKNIAWSADEGNLGRKLMERMGWSDGKGLGRDEQGRTEHIKVSYKNDSKGMGFKGPADCPVQQQDDFSQLLAELNQSDETPAPTTVQLTSLEKRSESSRARLHYKKFTRGKDLSRYSKKDLRCIIGSDAGLAKKKEEEAAVELENLNFGVQTTSGGLIGDYFKEKMKALGLLKDKSDEEEDSKKSMKRKFELEEEEDLETKKSNKIMKFDDHDQENLEGKEIKEEIESELEENVEEKKKKRKDKFESSESKKGKIKEEIESDVEVNLEQKESKKKKKKEVVENSEENLEVKKKKKKCKSEAVDENTESDIKTEKKKKKKNKEVENCDDDLQEKNLKSEKVKKKKERKLEVEITTEEVKSEKSKKKKKQKLEEINENVSDKKKDKKKKVSSTEVSDNEEQNGGEFEALGTLLETLQKKKKKVKCDFEIIDECNSNFVNKLKKKKKSKESN